MGAAKNSAIDFGDVVTQRIFLRLNPLIRNGKVVGFGTIGTKTRPDSPGVTIALDLSVPRVVFEPFVAQVNIAIEQRQVQVVVEPVEIAVPE